MITKSNDSKLYQDILKRANEIMVALGESDGIINSLDSLIDHMQDLATYEKNHPELDPLVMFLPTDEGIFEINANTRVITIPDVFKNGIGVQGDEIAEILYFSIDRYFDTTDLFDQDIYVQWMFKGDNAQYVTPVRWKSKAIKEGKIVFGWPISSEITDKPGEIQYSIRFYKRDEEASGRPILVYSLNTLTSFVRINSSLNFDIADEDNMEAIIVDKSQMIYDRMESSSTAASTPVFIIPASEQIIDLNDNDQDGVLSYRVEATAGFNALAKNRGDITYSWVSQTNDASSTSTSLSGTDVYFITEDEKRVNTKIYYIKNNDDTYSVYTQEDFDATEIYEHKTCLDLNEVGEYWAIAKNTWPLPTANPDTEINYKMAEGKSKKFIVPGPQEFDIDRPESWNDPLLIEDIKSGVELKAPAVNGQNEKDTLKYQWKVSPDANIENATPIQDATSNALTIHEEGYYSVEIKNTRNGAETESKNSLTRFAYPAADDFQIKGLKKPDGTPYEATESISVGATVLPNIFIIGQNSVGEFEYTWTPHENKNEILSSEEAFVNEGTYGSYTLTVRNVYINSVKTQTFNFFAETK